MANGQPGFTDSMFKLANQRSAALAREQQRQDRQDALRRQDIDAMSGFNASLIEGDEQKAIFEEILFDTQAFIHGTGEYEDNEYDPVEFGMKIASISRMYNAFSAHNTGDVKTAKDELNTSAHSVGGVFIGRGDNGEKLMTDNTITSYNKAVDDHNNYFKAHKIDGKIVRDGNGDPMGFERNPNGTYSTEPKSIWKMEAYSNPANFEGNVVAAPVDSIVDVAQKPTNVNRLTHLHNALAKDHPKWNPEKIQRGAVKSYFEDWWDGEGHDARDFRESILMGVLAAAPDGVFQNLDGDEKEKFIMTGEMSDDKEWDQIREAGESIYYDNSFAAAASAKGSGSKADDETLSDLFKGQVDITTNLVGIDEETGELSATGTTDVPMMELVNAYESIGGESGPYSVTHVGVSPAGTENAGGIYARVVTEQLKEGEVEGLGGTETFTYESVEIGKDAPTKQGREIWGAMGVQDDKDYQKWLMDKRIAALPDNPKAWNAAKAKRKTRLEKEEAVQTQVIDPIMQVVQDLPIFGEPQLKKKHLEQLNDQSPYTGGEEEFEGMTTSEVAIVELKSLLEANKEKMKKAATYSQPTGGGPGGAHTQMFKSVDPSLPKIDEALEKINEIQTNLELQKFIKEEGGIFRGPGGHKAAEDAEVQTDVVAEEPQDEVSSLPETQSDRSGSLNQETLVDQLQPWEVKLREQGSGVALLAKNFGNLRPNPANPYASGVYEVSGDNKYQTFDSYEQGLKGLVWDVKAKQFKDGLKSNAVEKDSNVLDVLKIWAPAEDKNNPDVYAKNVINFINEAEGTKYTTDSLFSELPTNKLVEAIIRQEDIKLYKKLKEDGFFDDKLASYSEGITKTNKV